MKYIVRYFLIISILIILIKSLCYLVKKNNINYDSKEKFSEQIKKKKIIFLPPSGRLGNQLFNLILALIYCFQNNINIVKLSRDIIFYDKDYLIVNDTDINLKDKSYVKNYIKNLNENDKFYMDNFWNIDIKFNDLKKYKNEIIFILNNKLNFPKVKKYNNNYLHIHIRSGDIWNYTNDFMIQPPCIYYENEINSRKWDKVIIVCEDRVNPCVEYLEKKYQNVKYFGENSLETDINELLTATNIIMGTGTFIPILSLFMQNLQKLHYIDNNDYRMINLLEIFHSNKCIKHNEYSKYFEIAKKFKEEKNNEKRKNLILNYKS